MIQGRTDQDVARYLRRSARSGQITKSILEIAKDVGYASATVHRSLKRLQEDGIIRVDRKDKKDNEPSTIYYLKEEPSVDLQEVALQIAAQLRDLAEQVLQLFNQEIPQENAEKWEQFQQRIVHVTDLPQQGLQLITVRQKD